MVQKELVTGTLVEALALFWSADLQVRAHGR
jgi:hypothetical protein